MRMKASGIPLSDPATSNQGRLSRFAALLPFIDETPAWEQLANPPVDGRFPPMGPSPSYPAEDFPLWRHQVRRFICPDQQRPAGGYGIRNFVMCYGDGIGQVGFSTYGWPGSEKSVPRDLQIELQAAHRGLFRPSVQTRFRDCVDGTSNTLMFSETVVDVKAPTVKGTVLRQVKGLTRKPSLANQQAEQQVESLDRAGRRIYTTGTDVWSVGKGRRWCEGDFTVNAFTSVLPPNSPSATTFDDSTSGVISASSHHAAGVLVAMADGSVHFVTSSIDAGEVDQTLTAEQQSDPRRKSAFGIWGAMGTSFGKEVFERPF